MVGKKLHNFEQEWRVQLAKREWQNLLSRAVGLGQVEGPQRVVDLVYGLDGFESVARHGWVLRLRKERTTSVELKEKVSADGWKETVSEVGNAQALAYMLRQLGVRPHLLLDRKRTTVTGTLYALCFDDMRGLGYFVEVEEINRPHKKSRDKLSTLVEDLRRHESKPPYGDIVKEKALRDRKFSKRYRALIRRYEKIGL